MIGFTCTPKFFCAASIAWRSFRGSKLSVSASTSTNTGRAPACSIACTPEQNVRGVVITASPGPIPSASNERCRAAVQELTAKASGAPMKAANSCSNRFTLGPVVIQSERNVSTTSAISSSPISGGENGKNVFLTNNPLLRFVRGFGDGCCLIWNALFAEFLVSRYAAGARWLSGFCRGDQESRSEKDACAGCAVEQ